MLESSIFESDFLQPYYRRLPRETPRRKASKPVHLISGLQLRFNSAQMETTIVITIRSSAVNALVRRSFGPRTLRVIKPSAEKTTRLTTNNSYPFRSYYTLSDKPI